MTAFSEFMKLLEKQKQRHAVQLPAGHDLEVISPFTPEQIACVESTFCDALGTVPRVGNVWFVDGYGCQMSTVVRCLGTPERIADYPGVGINVVVDEDPVATRSAVPALLRVTFANSTADQRPEDFNYAPGEVVETGQRMHLLRFNVDEYRAAVAVADEAF